MTNFVLVIVIKIYLWILLSKYPLWNSLICSTLFCKQGLALSVLITVTLTGPCKHNILFKRTKTQMIHQICNFHHVYVAQCFHNSKINFLEFITISWNWRSPQCACSMPSNVHNLHNVNALFKIILHRLGVGPSTKQIGIGLCEQVKRAIYNGLLFQTIIVIFFYMFTYIFHILEFPGISWNYFIFRKLPGNDQDFPEFRKFPSKWKHWCDKKQIIKSLQKFV